MNIKAGQAVRVDSTLSVRSKLTGQEEAQINTFYARSHDDDDEETTRLNEGGRRASQFG